MCLSVKQQRKLPWVHMDCIVVELSMGWVNIWLHQKRPLLQMILVFCRAICINSVKVNGGDLWALISALNWETKHNFHGLFHLHVKQLIAHVFLLLSILSEESVIESRTVEWMQQHIHITKLLQQALWALCWSPLRSSWQLDRQKNNS